MATFELDICESFLWRRLNVDPILQSVWIDRIYNGAPPQGVTRPHGLITLQTAGDDLAGNNVRTAARLTYLVRVIFEGEDLWDGNVAASRIDTLLDRTTGTVPEGSVLMCRRVGAFSLVEFPQGRRVNHRGGFYEMLVQANPN
jgi:hypothetical protein